MQGIIFYYSGSGNTKLACQYLVHHIEGIPFKLVDITQTVPVDFDGNDIAGFATFANFFGPPPLFQDFMEGLPVQEGKPAFVFNTYGSYSGRTLTRLAAWAGAKGFKIIAGHSLHTPESFPPLNVLGVGEHAPSERELKAFKQFVGNLNDLLKRVQAGPPLPDHEIQIDFMDKLMPNLPRSAARTLMGEKFVDASSCTECGICAKVCPYGAIQLAPKPVFDENRCYGCWACYNHCPEQAIHTKIFKGRGRYPHPDEQLREKLRF